jgi:hypothetical protein
MTAIAAILHRCPAFAGILLASMAARAECNLQTLTPHGSEVRAGAASVNLGQADNALNPTAWQGPLVAGACTLDVGIIEPPLLLAQGKLLYLPSYSGSMRALTLVDLNTCSVRWKSAAFSGRLAIGPRALHLGGKRIALDAHCVPVSRKAPAPR